MPEETKNQDLPRIWVKAGDPARVGLWERAPEHPGGEVWVSGDQVVEVAETTMVLQQLQSGALVRVSGPQGAPESKPEALPAPAPAATVRK